MTPTPPAQEIALWLEQQANSAERADPHGHMDVSMALTYAADAIRRAASALTAETQARQEAEKELIQARERIRDIEEEVATKHCHQCAGYLDPQKLRCIECDEQDKRMEKDLQAERSARQQAERARETLTADRDSWRRVAEGLQRNLTAAEQARARAEQRVEELLARIGQLDAQPSPQHAATDRAYQEGRAAGWELVREAKAEDEHRR